MMPEKAEKENIFSKAGVHWKGGVQFESEIYPFYVLRRTVACYFCLFCHWLGTGDRLRLSGALRMVGDCGDCFAAGISDEYDVFLQSSSSKTEDISRYGGRYNHNHVRTQ